MQALACVALKGGIGRIAADQTLRSGDFEMIVADDEGGGGSSCR